MGDLGSIPRLGRSPGEGKGYLLQYSGLENSMDCIVHGVEVIYIPHVSLASVVTHLVHLVEIILHDNN